MNIVVYLLMKVRDLSNFCWRGAMHIGNCLGLLTSSYPLVIQISLASVGFNLIFDSKCCMHRKMWHVLSSWIKTCNLSSMNLKSLMKLTWTEIPKWNCWWFICNSKRIISWQVTKKTIKKKNHTQKRKMSYIQAFI